MRIDRVRLVRAPLALVTPLRTSAGDHGSREAVLVEVTADDGTVGWGENVAPVGGFYTDESADNSLLALVDEFVPFLTAANGVTATAMTSAWWGVRGWLMAKHALSSAVWDAECRQRGVPLARALGGEPGMVKVGVVVGISDTVKEVVDEVLGRVSQGYGRIKVKIAPGHDSDVVRTVRAAIPAHVDLHVDGNGAYGPADVDHLASVCAIGVALVEQPFARNDLSSHAALAARTPALVCLDESVESVDDLERAVEMRACGSCNVKPARVGSFSDAVALLDACSAHGVRAWIGGMLESGIGRAGALALATHPACSLTPDLSASDRYFAADITEPFVLEDGCLRVPGGPGIGVEPLSGVLEDPRTRIETLFQR